MATLTSSYYCACTKPQPPLLHRGTGVIFQTQQQRHKNHIMSDNRNPFTNIVRKLSRSNKDSRSSTSGPPAAERGRDSMLSPTYRAPTNPMDSKNPFQDPSTSGLPPPYSAVAGPSAPTSSSAPANGDDPYDFLRTFDTIFLIDDSGSMAGGRWEETQAAISAIAPVCTKYDADGIDIYFLNHKHAYHNVQTARRVDEIFSRIKPSGGTPTGQRLHKILKEYLDTYTEATKPLNLICITDGEASDDDAAPLIQAAKKLDKLDAPAWQVS